MSDPELIREAIESRIFALSRSHDLLSRESWNGAELHDLVAIALAPFKDAASQPERFVIIGQKFRLPSKATLALGMAIHELATNTVKYSALSNIGGSVLVSWAVEPVSGGKELSISWQEKGGPTVTPPFRKASVPSSWSAASPMSWMARLTCNTMRRAFHARSSCRCWTIEMNKLLSAQRTLIVEDEMMLLMVLEDILTDLGCGSIAVAGTIKQALSLVSSRPFDSAVLDVNLNGEKSFPIADALGALDVPYIFATGYGIDALGAGYRDRPLLSKPYSYVDVENILIRLLPHVGAQRVIGSSARI
ncbi:response regulator [Rhizobium lusitanum]|nr:response regulator [Rhizobium lusitanum]